MTERVDTVVVGAGVVGLAVARRLALAGHEVIVLEAADVIGSQTSSRNSEVIHAGIYYPAGSLKARLCVAGRQALYEYCESRGVPHARIGKLIVASDEAQLPELDTIAAMAAINGVRDMVRLSRTEANAMEPAVRCAGALHSPSTGIIDSHALMLSYQGEAEAHGAMVAFNSRLTGGAVRDDGILLRVASGGEVSELVAERVVNAAGLGAQEAAGAIEGLGQETIPLRYLARGCYFTLAGASPFRHLVYPVPEPGGLGVHVTLDMAGQTRFGPDVEWIDDIDYTLDEARADRFAPAIRAYWPDLPDGALQPGYTGIRPKVAGQGAPAGDFMVQGPEAHGVPGLVNLYGIESPGLTASLAIAEMVGEMLRAS